MMDTVYIDGDTLPYMIGFATQRKLYMLEAEGAHTYGPFLVTKYKRIINQYLKLNPNFILSTAFFVEEPFQAVETLKLAIKNIVQQSKMPFFKVILSGETNFRTDIATIQGYKANRIGVEKPVNYELLREWLVDKSYTTITDNEEADDVISRAIYAGQLGASIDKDLDNTPGWHFNFNKGEIYEVSEEEALKNFYTQVLTGDTADNIPGIRGIGPATAGKILKECVTKEDYERAVLAQYAKVYDNPVSALIEVGQLLWMSRKEGEMWYPQIVYDWEDGACGVQ